MTEDKFPGSPEPDERELDASGSTAARRAYGDEPGTAEAGRDGETLQPESAHHLAAGDDQPGENLASEMLEDDVAPYTVAPDEHEAEELDGTQPIDPHDLVEDDAQLAEAEQEARTASSTRPAKRPQRRETTTPQLAEPEGEDLASTTVATTRPARRSTAPVKKDHATPRRDQHTEEARRRVGPVQFVRESAEELRKVIWPTGGQLWQYFVVVLVFVLFIIAFVSLIDLAIGWLLLQFIG